MKLSDVEFVNATAAPGATVYSQRLRASQGYTLDLLGDAVRATAPSGAERFYPLSNVRSWEALVEPEPKPAEGEHSAQDEHSAPQCPQCGGKRPPNARGEHCSKSCAARTREQRRAQQAG